MAIIRQVKNFELYSPFAFELTVAEGNNPGITQDRERHFTVGSIWINKTSGVTWRCVDDTVGAAVWVDASGGGGGTPWAMLEDPGEAGNISPTTSGVMLLSAGATRTLNVPAKLGQTLILIKTSPTADGTITVASEQNLDGSELSALELRTENAFVILQSIQTDDDPILYEWRITAPNADFITAGTIDDDILSRHIPKMTDVQGPETLSAVTSNAPISEFHAVCWSPTLALFVAVGGPETQIATSPDGMNWTTRASPNLNTWTNVCWSPALGLFCAVGANTASAPTVITSPNGINWTEQEGADNAFGWSGVCWAPQLNMFCAVSGYGVTRVMTSPDGIVWTPQTAFDALWTCICWSPDYNLFVAFASGGPGATGMSSPDGITWSPLTLPSEGDFNDVCYSSMLGRFIAVRDSNSGMMWSTDGVNWVEGVLTDDGWSWSGICGDHPSVVVAVSYDGLMAFTTNGNDWTVIPVDGDPVFSAVAWSPTLAKFVAVADADKNSTVSHVLTYASAIIRQKMPDVDGSAFTRIFYPEDYAAPIDHNKQPAILAAMAAANQAGGGIVLLGKTVESDYFITSRLSIPSGVTLRGLNRSTRLIANAPGELEAVTVSSYSGIENLILECNSLSSGIRSSGNQNRMIRDVIVRHTTNYGVSIENSFDNQGQNTIDNVFVDTVAGIGFKFGEVGDFGCIRNLKVKDTTNEAISLQSASYLRIDGVHLINAGSGGDSINANSVAIVLTGLCQNSVISNVTFDTDSQYPTYLAGDYGSLDCCIEAAIPNGMTPLYPSLESNLVIRDMLEPAGVTTTDASLLISGTLNDERLSGRVPITTELMGDGITVAFQSSPSHQFTSVCYNDDSGVFIAVAKSGTNRSSSLNSGQSAWGQNPIGDSDSNSWSSVCYASALSRFVAVSTDGVKRIAYSPDGLTWINVTAPVDEAFTSVCWSPDLNLFVAVTMTDVIIYSADGITWNVATAPESASWSSVCWSIPFSKFIAVNTDGTDRIMVSDDGITWTAQTAPEMNSWNCVLSPAGSGRAFAVSSDGTNRSMYTDDGITWQTITTSFGSWTCLSYDPNQNVWAALGGATGQVMIFSNGAWATFQTGLFTSFTAMAFGDDFFIGVANANPVLKFTFGQVVVGHKLPALDGSLLTNIYTEREQRVVQYSNMNISDDNYVASPFQFLFGPGGAFFQIDFMLHIVTDAAAGLKLKLAGGPVGQNLNLQTAQDHNGYFPGVVTANDGECELAVTAAYDGLLHVTYLVLGSVGDIGNWQLHIAKNVNAGPNTQLKIMSTMIARLMGVD